MSPLKCVCPSCTKVLKLPAGEELPAKVKCPRCATRFLLDASGAVHAVSAAAPGSRTVTAAPLLAPAAAESEFASFDLAPAPGPAPRRRPAHAGTPARWPMLVGIIGVGVLFLAGGIALAVYSFSGSATDDDLTETPAKTTRTVVVAVNETPAKPNPVPQPQPTQEKKAPPKKADPVPRRVVPVPPKKAELPPKPPVEEALPPALQKKVNQAIERGVAYLKASLTIDAVKGDPTIANTFHLTPHSNSLGIPVSHPGVPALMGLTLMACGVPATDAVVQKAATLTRTAAPSLTHCYSLAIAILFLDRLGEARDRDLIQKMALQLVAGQTPRGGWGYNCRALSRTEQEQLLTFLKDPQGQPNPALRNLAVVQFQAGKAWQLPAATLRDDNSNTQFVSLALWAARKHGVPLERTFALVQLRFRDTQSSDGSWPYASWCPQKLRDPTTCAALLGLAVGHGGGPRAKQALSQDPVVKKGLAFLSRAVGKPPLPANTPEPTMQNPRGKFFGADAAGDLYFLWSVERVAMIYSLKKIGDKDWYPWGADLIVARQNQDGSWTEWYPGVPDTCFALLFLKRANVAPDLTSKIKEIEASITSQAPRKTSDQSNRPADGRGQ